MPRKKTTSQKRAELKQMAGTARMNIFHMLQLATDILGDAEYVDQFGGEPQLVEQMEADEFGHFGGEPPLRTMLLAYRTNPNIGVWEEHQFSITAMIALATPAPKKDDSVRTNWKKKALESEAKNDQDAAVIAELRETVAELRKRCEKAEHDAAELRGQVKELRTLLDRRMVAA